MKTTKKAISIVLAGLMTAGSMSALSVSAVEETSPTLSFKTQNALYAHAVSGSADSDAWVAWQCEHNEYMNEINANQKYFFLPSSVSSTSVELYNAYSNNVTVNNVTIPSGESREVSYTIDKSTSVSAGGKTYSLTFLKSSAESAIYVNNSNADGNGSELISYLSEDKSNSASATGAIVDRNGKIDNTSIKKIKGRGNSTWVKAKKPFNITYSDKVSIGGMAKSKKFSLLANYQDDSLTRNRFLYDLADAVGTPYASDSRYVDFYSDGYYWGSYQITEKIEVGKNALINDIDDTAYLDADGNVNKDFSFLCEVDSNAVDGEDYYVKCNDGIKVTIKAPELSEGDKGYDEVKNYVREKYNAFHNAAKNTASDLSQYADVDSCAKLWLINELGKNWDSGVSSVYFVYKQDSDGNYKFFGSPVWDYDNSLGNATGSAWDLKNFGVKDYTQYSGWWCRFKDRQKRTQSSTNIINNFSRNTQVNKAAVNIWFEKFVPAINYFAGKTQNYSGSNEFYSKAQYYDLLKDSAEMNYKSGWYIKTSSWISDHTSMNKADFDIKTGTYTVSNTKTSYNQNSFTDMYNYAADWMTSRAAWISNEWFSEYTPSEIKGDVDGDGTVTVMDATLVQKYIVNAATLTADQIVLADINGDGTVTVLDATCIQKLAIGAL